MFNKRKVKCGYCGKTLKKGEGGFTMGSITSQKFYTCFGGCKNKDIK